MNTCLHVLFFIFAQILSKLEKRISVIWRKRKVAVASDASQNPLSQDVCHDNPLNNVNTTNQTCDLEIAPVSKSESGSNLEYSMCDQCGQVNVNPASFQMFNSIQTISHIDLTISQI